MMIKRLTAFLIAMTISLSISAAWSMSAYAAKVYTQNYSNASVSTNQTVTSDFIRNYTNGLQISNWSSQITFKNDGVVNVNGGSYGFMLYLATFENNGTFTFTGSNSTFSFMEPASFVNNGAATINGVYNFGVQDGTSFENNGTLYLENIQSFNLGGFVNNGVIVIPDDEKNSALHLALEQKNGEKGQVYTKTEFDNRKLNYSITYEGLNADNYQDFDNDQNPAYYEWAAAAPQDVTLTEPTLPGYEFLGWTCAELDITLPEKALMFSSSVCKDITVTANWKKTEYTISYDLDGGSFSDTQTPPSDYTRGNQKGIPSPSKSGYMFNGWIDNDTGTQMSTASDNFFYMPADTLGNKTYKASFIANTDTQYKVVCYYRNIDGTYDEEKFSLAGETDAQVSVSSENYVKQGFTFDSDNSGNVLSGTIKADNSLELKLYFDRNKYTVTFKSQDGSATLWTTEKYFNETVGEYGGDIPAKTSDDDLYTYVFDNWARDESDRDFGYDVSNVVVSEDITFYAAFKKVRDESIVVITWEEYDGFHAPAQTEIRLDKGTDYTTELRLINENYYIGTREWHIGFQEAHFYWYDTQSGEQGVEYTVDKENFEAPVILTIPDVQHDTFIKIKAHYHDEHDYSEEYDEVIRNGNCTSDSVIRHFCYKCGKTYDETVPADGHVTGSAYENDKISHWKSCSICGEKIGLETHTPDEGIITHEPTHNSTGTKTYTCIVCGYVTGREVLPMIQHTSEGDWQSNVRAHYKICSCGAILDEASHTPDEGTVVLEPTYDTEGKIEYRCTVCGYLIGETAIAPLGHNVEEEWQSEMSGHWHNCECGERHDFGEHISDGGLVTVEPTYEECGERVFSCTVCGYVLSVETLPPLSHRTDGDWVSDEENHWKEGCGCGEKHELAAHIPDNGTVTLYPTETAEGKVEYRCTVCGYVIKTEVIPALGGGSGIPSEPTSPTEPSEPTDPADPTTPDEPITPSRPDNEVPFIKDENGKNGWEVINEEIGKAEGGSTVNVDMNGAMVVPGNVFDTLRGRDVTVVFDMGGGITWSVNGKDVTFGNTSDIDFSVKADTDNIPVDVINNITGERYSIQISLAHNGEFGFTAVLSINLGSGNAGRKASLYYYNGGALELMCESEISADGTARLKFTHASDYLIVIGESKTDEGDTSDTTSGESNPSEDDNSGTTSGATSSVDISESGKKDPDEQNGNPSTGVATSLIPLAIAAAFIVAAAKRKMK